MLEEAVLQFIKYLKEVKEASENTVVSYHQDLEKFLQFLEEQSISSFEQVTETLLYSYVLSLEKKSKSSTVARNIVTLKAFFLFLVKKRIIDADPAERIKSPKIVKQVPQNLSESDVEILLNAPNIATASGKRDKAMFELLYATGIKVSEMVHLTVGDINLQYNILTCSNAKKQRVVPFGESARAALISYLEEARSELMKDKEHDYLFVNRHGECLTRQGFWKVIKRYATDHGIEHVTPQAFRNSFASHLIENGANVITVGEMLGYSNNSMAYVYAKNKEARVRDEYMKAHPRA